MLRLPAPRVLVSLAIVAAVSSTGTVAVAAPTTGDPSVTVAPVAVEATPLAGADGSEPAAPSNVTAADADGDAGTDPATDTGTNPGTDTGTNPAKPKPAIAKIANRKATAGKSWKVSVKVKNPVAGKLELQQRKNGAWVTRKRQSVAGKQAVATVVFTMRQRDRFWYALASSKWRVVLRNAAKSTAATGSVFKLTVRPRYAPSKRYYQPKTSIAQSPGIGYNLTRGMNGMKVSKVQKALGMGSRWETMDYATISRVKAFQRKHGLRANGVVNLKTWLALGLKKSDWYGLDTWHAPVQVGLDATRKQRVEAMVGYALKYRKSHYVWGGAGSVKDGADCSGMILQALYAAGIDPRPITTVKHSLPLYRSSRELMKLKRFKHVPLSQRRRGDIIFYAHGSAPISHVSLYLGNGKIIELLPGGPVVRNFSRSTGSGTAKSVVVRPFP
ncbi:putative peptidoglycan binding protein [Rarobacter incanus]|uniref:Putative peptidoglycan binding protein n=2 Tax=Rarobacter incanus TaxID=153494 RepID=A0A542SLR4_9MICO|nr:putative peptidoglycan binding protein [Rarobacter incanus]